MDDPALRLIFILWPSGESVCRWTSKRINCPYCKDYNDVPRCAVCPPHLCALLQRKHGPVQQSLLSACGWSVKCWEFGPWAMTPITLYSVTLQHMKTLLKDYVNGEKSKWIFFIPEIKSRMARSGGNRAVCLPALSEHSKQLKVDRFVGNTSSGSFTDPVCL